MCERLKTVGSLTRISDQFIESRAACQKDVFHFLFVVFYFGTQNFVTVAKLFPAFGNLRSNGYVFIGKIVSAKKRNKTIRKL